MQLIHWGQERHSSEITKHGCDRTKTPLDIVRAGIEVLSNNLPVLPVLEGNVRRRKTEDVIDIESRFVAIEQRLRKNEGLSDSPELLKPDVEVTESELHTDLCNLRTENDPLRADYAKLLESRKFSQQIEMDIASIYTSFLSSWILVLTYNSFFIVTSPARWIR
jgi:hypothetical protein